jgi:hypothetical protein
MHPRCRSACSATPGRQPASGGRTLRARINDPYTAADLADDRSELIQQILCQLAERRRHPTVLLDLSFGDAKQSSRLDDGVPKLW